MHNVWNPTGVSSVGEKKTRDAGDLVYFVFPEDTAWCVGEAV